MRIVRTYLIGKDKCWIIVIILLHRRIVMSLEVFSKRIKELMAEENVSDRALAETIGVQRKSIFLWKSGRYYPKYDALIRLVYHFEVSAEYLLGLSEQADRVVKKDGKDDSGRVFKERLIKFMKENGYSKYKMSKLLGVGQSVFTRWVTKCAIPEVSSIIKLSQLMDESIGYILGIED